MQQVTPRTGRILPGMPLDVEDMDGDDDARPGARGYRSKGDARRGAWWRPASTTGRVFLAFCAFLALSGLITAGVLLKNYLEHNAQFRVDSASDIQATGLSEVSPAQVLSVFRQDIGSNIFLVPLNKRREQLEAIPWVDRAAVMRILPNRIRVAIVERTPVAFVREGRQIELVDAQGVVLPMKPAAIAAHHYSFPVLIGIDPRDPQAARAARVALYLRMMRELDSTGQHYAENISEVNLTDPEDAQVLTPEAGRDILAHFGESHFLERYLRFRAHIAGWLQQYPQLAAVDLRYKRQVVLQMASGADATANEDKPSAAGQVENGGRGQERRAAEATTR